MLATSQKFKEAIESSTRQIKTRIILKGITYVNSDVFSVEYNGGSITGDTFNIGSTFSNNIKVTFSSVIEGLLLDDEIKLEFGVVLSDLTVEYVKMGTFYITSYDPQRNDFKTVIEASDKMIQLNGTYESELSYPSTIKKVAMEIANKAGLLVNETSFSRLSDMPINEPSGYTYRQAIGLIAQFECGFALIDRNGLLDIRMLSDPEYAVNPDSYFSKGLTKDETNYQIGGINCKVVTKNGDSSETTTLQSGSTSGAQISIENNVMTQTLLDDMYQKLRNLNYFPFTLSWRGNPSLESGDWITVVDLKGTRLKVPNLNYKLTFSGGLKATSSANTQTISSSSYQYKGNLQQQIIELSGRIGAAGNHIYDSLEEPLNPKEKDLWFKPNGPDTEIWIYQDGEWVFQVSTATNPEIIQAIEQAKTEAEDAKTSAQDAVDKANVSVAAVQANTQLINDVNIVANNAKNQAQTAATNAQTALTNANAAKTTAQTALDKANGVSSKVTTIETNIDTINGTLSSKANTTDLNALKGRLSTAETNITQNANDILQKASKTDVNTLTGRVTSAEGSISTMAGQIALKANQTDVNTITGKVSSLESNFTIQSGQISALNTKTDGHTTQIGSLQSSYSGLVSTVSNVQNDLNNLSIGGENLLFDTDVGSLTKVNGPKNRYFSDASNSAITDIGFKQVSDSPTPSGFVVEATSVGGGTGGRRIAFYSGNTTFPFVKGETYTMSCYARKISGSPKIPFQYWNSVEGSITSNVDVDSTEWRQYSWTFVYNFDNPSFAYMGGISGLTAGTLQSCGFKLERGNRATAWGLSQYELATVTALSELSQDVSGFKQTVANTYLTKTDANNLYPTNTTVTSQISQSATEVRQDIQSWTNGRLTDYSTIQSTSNSIASAVADKVTQTQWTQLSNQFTSTVSQISNNSNLFSINKMKQSTSYHPDYTTFLLVEIATDVGATYTASSDHPSQNLWFMPANNSSISANTYRVYNGKTVTFIATSAKSYVAIRDTSTKSQLANETYHLKVERGLNATDWSPSAQDSASQTQFTQTIDDFNLRIVEKGTVTTQINLESGQVLIDTNQLLLSASTVKFTGSAFIPNAMIQSITADKITAGTINAANVNIINLNAANITTGTLTGANLSMNLNTGEVLFQKGAIRKTDGNFVIDITNGEISSDDSNGGFSLKSGALNLRRKVDNAEYGSINYGLYDLGQSSLGISITGNKGYMLRTSNFVGSGGGINSITGTGIYSQALPSVTSIRIEAQDGVHIAGGPAYQSTNNSLLVPMLSVGGGITYQTSIIGKAKSVYFYALNSSGQSSIVLKKGTFDISSADTSIYGKLYVTGSKNAIHATRDGIRATPAYETAESYLGDIGSNYTRQNCEVWVPIEGLFSDTVNTDIAYHVFLQAYDDAHFWVSDFKSDKFLIKSDKPMARFAWEIKAKRRGYEKDRLVLQDEITNKQIEDAWRESA
ncbi:MAG: hypothetical protein LKF42_09200 [Streptococcaceae bacterium]|jgi:hypothetical protein|nr:hypothetical protein [Streptococcaceae bacterium]MCH4178120.1 hypothetical protein [Streptococcaceae bacterium]